MSNTTGGWRPDERLGQLPPEYEPVHHEPRRRPDPRHTRPRQPDPQGNPYPGGAQPQPQYPRSEGGYPPRPQPRYQYPPQPPQARPQYPPQPQPQWHQAPPQHARYEDPRDPRGFMPGFTNGDDGYDDHGYADQQENEWVEPGQQAYAGQFHDDYEPEQERPRRRGPVRRLAPWIALLVILIPLGIGGGFVYHLYQSKYHPPDFSGPGTGSVQVQVKPLDDATSLGPVLVNLGVVASSRAFVLAAEHSSSTKGLIPGYYLMHKHMQASLAYAMLLNPANVIQTTITFPEGFRASQVIARLAARDKHMTQAALQQALKNPALGLPPYANGNPEGYLYPDTYAIPPNATALSVLQQMVQSFTNEATNVNLEQAATQAHLSPTQVIIVASLLQAEGGRLSDYPKIARVVYNRLAQHIKLQFDSTVLYGLNAYGILANSKQLQSTSPYNTYKYAGLPPGPIDNPGSAAIQAALHPAPGNWIYFVTTDPKTGYTQFTNSYTQFLQFQQELRRNTGH